MIPLHFFHLTLFNFVLLCTVKHKIMFNKTEFRATIIANYCNLTHLYILLHTHFHLIIIGISVIPRDNIKKNAFMVRLVVATV